MAKQVLLLPLLSTMKKDEKWVANKNGGEKKNLGICGRERKKEENGEILGRWSFAREQKRKGWLKDPLVHEKLLGIHVQILEQSKKNNKRKKEEGLRCGGSGGGGWWDMEFLSSDFQWFYWLSKLLHKIRIQPSRNKLREREWWGNMLGHVLCLILSLSIMGLICISFLLIILVIILF